MWTAVVVTCPQQAWCQAVQEEVAAAMAQTGEAAELVLVVPDPGTTGGVGSGGASLNALLVLTEHLSARAGHTTIVPELLAEAKVLILHLGPATALPLPTGLAYVPSSTASPLPSTSLARSLTIASLLARDAGPGVLVASTDILLTGALAPHPGPRLQGDLVLLTVPCSRPEYASRHGVAVLSSDSSVSTILYQPRPEDLQPEVSLLAGQVWLSPPVAESLLKLHSLPPVDSCTYMGADSGGPALAVSLYYDLLPATCSGVTKQDFVEGRWAEMFHEALPHQVR